MRILKLSTAIAGLVWHQAAASAALPPPTGPYHVGLQKHVAPVLNEADPFWPNNISTSFLVTVYYPTTQDPSPHDWQRPYLDPATAALYEARYNLTTGSLSVLPSPGLIPNAKPLDFHRSKPLPTLFFTPRRRPPTEVYTLLLSDLASHGYCVLALNHPYEQPFVRYPNGTGIYGLPILYAWDEPTVLAVQSTRVNDSLALLDYLPNLEGETGLELNKTHVGIFGHSLGGSAAAATLLAAERERHDRTAASSFRAGMNIDGTFFGPLSAVQQPFLMLGAEAHGTSPDPNDSDATWPAFAAAQQKTTSAYWCWVNLRGTRHHDFSDIGYWKQAVPAIRDGDQQLGSIGGERLVEVWRAYVRGFFDVALVGEGDGGGAGVVGGGGGCGVA
ncbi:hypothetical protein PG993_003788 [Apiospora rasikravindrae]|uniref:1-alkyl-2-acetylglycerophosphocholine esterase n=1 Tax=Apiospora rasikravindrae TaxID=990691 RepID=A0ABR1U0S1_9PEZI